MLFYTSEARDDASSRIFCQLPQNQHPQLARKLEIHKIYGCSCLAGRPSKQQVRIRPEKRKSVFFQRRSRPQFSDSKRICGSLFIVQAHFSQWPEYRFETLRHITRPCSARQRETYHSSALCLFVMLETSFLKI